MTALLRCGVTAIGKDIGLKAQEISARSMRAGGAMALLLGRVDSDTIRLIGRWRSDEMLRYLHTSARQLMHNYANTMVAHGNYELIGVSTPSQQGGT
eukprot:7831563-Ditylum_brightwellii.AAC.1